MLLSALFSGPCENRQGVRRIAPCPFFLLMLFDIIDDIAHGFELKDDFVLHFHAELRLHLLYQDHVVGAVSLQVYHLPAFHGDGFGSHLQLRGDHIANLFKYHCAVPPSKNKGK